MRSTSGGGDAGGSRLGVALFGRCCEAGGAGGSGLLHLRECLLGAAGSSVGDAASVHHRDLIVILEEELHSSGSETVELLFEPSDAPPRESTARIEAVWMHRGDEAPL